MYNCVMVKIKETDTVYVALSDGLCFFVFFFEGWGVVGFMGQT